MLRKIVNVLVILPLAVILIVFAVANRHLVTLSFDPFNSNDPAFGLDLPLFLIIIGAAMFGVVAGGIAMWFGQHRWRKAARRHEAEVREARTQLANLRSQAQGAVGGGEGQIPGHQVPGYASGRLPAIPAPQYAAIGRDKPGATL